MKKIIKKLFICLCCIIMTFSFSSCDTLLIIEYYVLHRETNFTDINIDTELTGSSIFSVQHDITVKAYNEVKNLAVKINYYNGNTYEGSTVVSIGNLNEGETITKTVYPDIPYLTFIQIDGVKYHIEKGFTPRF